MAYEFINLVDPQNTTSGIADYVLIAPVSDFAVNGIKCPKAPFSEKGDEIKVKEAHVFKAGRGFAKFTLAPDKNKLDGATIGDRGFQKLDLTLDIVIPGSYAELHEAMKNFMNKPLIALVKDADCPANMWYQLGCDCVYAWLTTDFTTGTTADGIKGYNAKINYKNGYVQLYAAGDPVVLSDGSSV